jgi:hypothetical protein
LEHEVEESRGSGTGAVGFWVASGSDGGGDGAGAWGEQGEGSEEIGGKKDEEVEQCGRADARQVVVPTTSEGHRVKGHRPLSLCSAQHRTTQRKDMLASPA